MTASVVALAICALVGISLTRTTASVGVAVRAAPTVARSPEGPPLPGSGSVLGRRGQILYLHNRPQQLTGVNAYQLATDFSFNYGCGGPIDLDSLFSRVGAGHVVRTFILQTDAVDRATRTFDWAAIDRLFAAAARHHVLLIGVLSDQTGNCDDGHWHDQAWYGGGYRSVFDDNGNHTNLVSFWTWLHLVVARYRNSPALAMWEPVNEPQTSDCSAGFVGKDCYGHGSCPGGNAELLRAFFDTVGGELHRLDPAHLVSSGTIGNGECGDWMQYYQLVGASVGIDVLTVHDYDPTPLDATMAQHVTQAAALGKPLVFEEVSIASGPGCSPTIAQRAATLKTKEKVDLAQGGVEGFLLWQWTPTDESGCNVAYGPGDPALTSVAGFTTAG